MEIYNKIFSSWLKFAICPALVGGFCAVVTFLYVTLRHTNLPIFIYLAFPYSAVTLMGLLLWISYDADQVMKSSRQLCLQLRSLQAPCFSGWTKSRREKAVKRALACRPCTFPVGIFADFSLTVPLRIWEEILNQLMLLLSL